jgi:hypothetical protein
MPDAVRRTAGWIPTSLCVGLGLVYAPPAAAQTVGFRGPRDDPFATPGAPPTQTRSMDAIRSDAEDRGHGCGSLSVNDRPIPNEHPESIDMSSIAVIVTLPGSVGMYTYDFDWSFRPR